MRFRDALCLLPLLLLACDDGAATSGAAASGATAACDPLATHVEPTEVGAVRAIGRDGAGQLYVLTNDLRVFSTHEGGLRRRRVEGSGTIGETTITVTLRESESATAVLQVDLEGGTPRMGIVREAIPGKTFVIGEIGEELTVLGPSAIEGLAASQELSATLQHRARLVDGRLLVITAPADFTSFDQLRAFFGPPDALAERVLRNYARTRGLPGADFFEIEIDGVTGMVHIGNGPDGTGELRLGGDPLALTEQASLPANASFSCLAP